MNLSKLISSPAEQLKSVRKLASEVRTDATLEMSIDPGFINQRLVHSVMSSFGVEETFRQFVETYPTSSHPQLRELQMRHAVVTAVLKLGGGSPSLSQFACSPEKLAPLVCSTDHFQGRRFKRGQDRAELLWKPTLALPAAKLRFSIEHIVATTSREELQQGCYLSHVSRFVGEESGVSIFQPLVMGAPLPKSTQGESSGRLLWYRNSLGPLFVEDLDEFSKVRDVPFELEWEPTMSKIPEVDFKRFLAGLLSEKVDGDWGGELRDLYSTRVHVGGRRMTAAFLLKGPGSGFRPMTGRHLGKNGDQIYRLACTPADLLVIQHCHEISEPVTASLKAFAIQPGRFRRFMLIDGRDSFRLLYAHGVV